MMRAPEVACRRGIETLVEFRQTAQIIGSGAGVIDLDRVSDWRWKSWSIGTSFCLLRTKSSERLRRKRSWNWRRSSVRSTS